MPETSLDGIPALAPHANALKALGYSSVESFLAAARVASPEMSAYLGADVNVLIGRLPEAFHPARIANALPRRFALGADLLRIPRTSKAFRISIAAPPSPLPATVNWIAQMPPVRDQSQRGTCVSFASLAVIEHYQGLQNAYQDMSEQLLYWDCKQNDGQPNSEGTYIAVAMKCLQQDGCCLETVWPYNGAIVPGNEGQGPPPGGAAAQALNYKDASFNQLAPTSTHDIRKELARQRCVAFDIPVFNSWYQSTVVLETGEITMPIPGEQPVGGHAMCIVGYADDTTNPALGGGKFIIRNSWGSVAWATQSPYQPGYGTIPYAYIASYGQEAYSIY